MCHRSKLSGNNTRSEMKKTQRAHDDCPPSKKSKVADGNAGAGTKRSQADSLASSELQAMGLMPNRPPQARLIGHSPSLQN